MTKKIALFCVLIGVVAFLAAPAYAEVQNIKVSGDITAMGVHRSNYDLEDESRANVYQTGATTGEDDDSFLMSIVRLRVDADLTDNVAACIRLANAREWDNDSPGVAFTSSDIWVDLANVTLKEMLYSPLTLVIGRQELMYGNGLIVGPARFQDPDNTIWYNDLSPLHAYDGVRAILDYDPWTVNLLFVKIFEDEDIATAATVGKDDDTDLYGVNLGYKFAQYDAEMEGYFFAKRDENWNTAVTTFDAAGVATYRRTYEENDVYTVGLRGSVVPAENLTLAAEVAGQFGEIRDDIRDGGVAAGTIGATLDIGADCGNSLSRDREALAANVSGKYDFADVRFAPILGIEYLYLSGEEADNQTGDYEVWDLMYRGKIMGSIRDCLGVLYGTNDAFDTNGWTNQHTIKATGSLDLGELVDGLSLDLAYLHYWFVEEPLPGAEDEIGDEVGLKVTYDYTEDVQFILDNALFMPGDYYDDVHGAGNRVSNDTAISVIGSCKVTF